MESQKYCKHEECPYKGCGYHMYTTNSSAPFWDELPVYMPKSQEEMEVCVSYLDI